MPVNITFTAAFSGHKNLWQEVTDHASQITGWQQVGSWTVVAPSVVTISPAIVTVPDGGQDPIQRDRQRLDDDERDMGAWPHCQRTIPAGCSREWLRHLYALGGTYGPAVTYQAPPCSQYTCVSAGYVVSRPGCHSALRNNLSSRHDRH